MVVLYVFEMLSRKPLHHKLRALHPRRCCGGSNMQYVSIGVLQVWWCVCLPTVVAHASVIQASRTSPGPSQHSLARAARGERHLQRICGHKPSGWRAHGVAGGRMRPPAAGASADATAQRSAPLARATTVVRRRARALPRTTPGSCR
jgi:hypothetical protein